MYNVHICTLYMLLHSDKIVSLDNINSMPVVYTLRTSSLPELGLRRELNLRRDYLAYGSHVHIVPDKFLSAHSDH